MTWTQSIIRIPLITTHIYINFSGKKPNNFEIGIKSSKLHYIYQEHLEIVQSFIITNETVHKGKYRIQFQSD